MSIRRDNLIIIDVESTCWENSIAPPGQQSEIIEIGVCLLDLKTLDRTDKRSILVKPERSKISVFCTQLTSITPEMVASEGIAFAEACDMLRSQYASEGRAWASWGNYDRKMFESQCDDRRIAYPFTDSHLNAKKLFGNLERGGQGTGMSRAMQHIKLPLEGTHHRGGDDAWNIAAIAAWMIRKHGKDILLDLWGG
jgi:inhibitor of KinA sporulation pathway (predicted exonuclease)